MHATPNEKTGKTGCCEECGVFEQNIQGERSVNTAGRALLRKRCRTSRTTGSAGGARGRYQIAGKGRKFSDTRYVGNALVKDIPSLLKAYAAMLIESEGLSEEEVIRDMVQTFRYGIEQNSLDRYRTGRLS